MQICVLIFGVDVSNDARQSGDAWVSISIVHMQLHPDVTGLFPLQVDCNKVLQIMPFIEDILGVAVQHIREVVCCHFDNVITIHVQLVTVVWPYVGVEDGCTFENDSCIVKTESFLAALVHFLDVTCCVESCMNKVSLNASRSASSRR